MKIRLFMVTALCAGFALALGSSQAHAASQPPIPVFPPAGDIPPPSGAIVDSREPITPCTDWYVQSVYVTWATNREWWAYSCSGPGGMTDGDDDYWSDVYYWDGSQSVFYGEMHWYYDWVIGGHCAYWWDEATSQWYDPWGCSEPPTPSFSYSCSSLSCDFDGSTSSDTDGTIVAYDWSFRDGTLGSGATVQHTFAYAGTYDVYLTVTDDLGWQGLSWWPVTVTVTVPNVAPTGAFTSGCAGLVCSFDGSGSSDVDGTIVSHAWGFGDGTSGSGATVQHTYAQPGAYAVTLTVTDDDGATGTVSQSVVVTANAPPVAALSSVCNGLTCTFDGAGSSDNDGTIAAYSWSFGDGTTGSSASTQHTYTQAGAYTVTLTVTDDDGAIDSDSKTVALIALTATGYKVKGVQKVDLAWTGASATGFDVFRNGAKIATVQANAYTDNINQKGQGGYVYKVCAAQTSVCSNETAVSF